MKNFYRYLPISPDIYTRSIYIIGGGYTFIPPHTPYPPTVHPADHDFRWQHGRTLHEYQLIYIIRGGGYFESQSCPQRKIEAGDIFMLFPDEWHRYAPDQATGWDEYWVAFHGHLAGILLEEFPFSPDEPIKSVSVDLSLTEAFLQLIEEMRLEQAEYQKVMSAQLMLLLSLAIANPLRRSMQRSENRKIFEEAKVIMGDSIDKDIQIEEIAKRLHVGYSWFRRMFREAAGMAPAQYLLHLKINEASGLLRNTTLPIHVISGKTGFESAYYFARIFRQKTGMSPSAYRAKVQTPEKLQQDINNP